MNKKNWFMAAALTVVSTTVMAQTSYPWMDTSKSFRERAELLCRELTLREKVDQLGNNVSEPIKRDGQVILPSYQYWNEALHGVARSGAATSFPESKGMSATWDEMLVRACAEAISDEARIYHETKGKGLNYWSPTINMARDPRWGREEENYGEDPLLAGRLAVEFIKGFQGEITPATPYYKLVACAKHFAANNYEQGRQSTTSFVTEKNMREYYLPAFEMSVREGGVKSIMAAYNAFSIDPTELDANNLGAGKAHGGLPCCANKMLLTDILRKEWGFNGYVTSDCAGLSCVHRAVKHKYFGDYTAGKNRRRNILRHDSCAIRQCNRRGADNGGTHGDDFAPGWHGHELRVHEPFVGSPACSPQRHGCSIQGEGDGSTKWQEIYRTDGGRHRYGSGESARNTFRTG